MDGIIIIDEPRSGDWNMAMDRTLADHSRKHSLCIMRLYLWKNPTLSLGYFQSVPTTQEHGALAQLDMVRRETGGGAIVHDHDVTYSIVMPDDAGKGHAGQLYRIVHQALIDWLNSHGVQTQFFSDHPSAACDSLCNNDRFLCFDRRSDFDLVVKGNKILGSAQRRHAGVIMQHGSLLVRRSTFANHLSGVEESLAANMNGISGRGEYSPVDWLNVVNLQEALSVALSCKLSQEFAVKWLGNGSEIEVCKEPDWRILDQFQSFDWLHRA